MKLNSNLSILLENAVHDKLQGWDTLKILDKHIWETSKRNWQ